MALIYCNSNVNRNKPFISFVLLSLVMGVVTCLLLFIIRPKSSSLAKSGVMDLRGYDFKSDGRVTLFGEWAFYWDQVLTEETYDSVIGRAPDLYVSVPSYWDDLSRIDHRIQARGVATYSLTILKDFENEVDILAFKTHNITPNADIYIDGKRISEIGKIDSNREKSVSANRTVLMPIEASGDSMTIAISISNYHNISGGLNRSICFGLYEDLLDLREKNLTIDSVFLGGLLLMVLYQFSALILSRKRIAPLYLGLLGVFCFLFAGLKGEMALLTIFPGLDGEIRAKIIFLAFSLAGPIFTLYCSSFYPGYFHPKLNRMVLPIVFVMTVLVAFTPMEIYSQYVFLLSLFTAAFIVYTMLMLSRALHRTGNHLIMLSLFGAELLTFCIVLGVVDNSNQTVFRTIAGAFFLFSVYQSVLEVEICSNAFVKISMLFTERQKLAKLNADFFTQVFIDRDTGMYNRVLLNGFLQSKWAPDRLNDKHSIAMILIDVDYFKFYKNAYGHKRSENVMTQLSRIVGRDAGDMNRHVSVRYGEDVFAILMADIDEFSLYRSADRFRTMVESKNIEHGFARNSKILTVSVGCATITPSKDNDPGTLIDSATRALMLAKKNGRNRTEII